MKNIFGFLAKQSLGAVFMSLLAGVTLVTSAAGVVRVASNFDSIRGKVPEVKTVQAAIKEEKSLSQLNKSEEKNESPSPTPTKTPGSTSPTNPSTVGSTSPNGSSIIRSGSHRRDDDIEIDEEVEGKESDDKQSLTTGESLKIKVEDSNRPNER